VFKPAIYFGRGKIQNFAHETAQKQMNVFIAATFTTSGGQIWKKLLRTDLAVSTEDANL
jgi:hypothetical protein